MNVNWDDDIPNIWENKIDVPNHQPVILNLLESMGNPQSKIKKGNQTTNQFQFLPPNVGVSGKSTLKPIP